MDTSYDGKKYMLVKECLEASGYANSYFRMKILKPGKVESVKEMIPGTQIPRTLVVRASFEKYMAEHPRSARLVLTEEMKKVLRDNGFSVS